MYGRFLFYLQSCSIAQLLIAAVWCVIITKVEGAKDYENKNY